MTRVFSFINSDGVMVHAAEVSVEVRSSFGKGDRSIIERNYGTFAKKSEAEERIQAVLNGTYQDDDMVD